MLTGPCNVLFRDGLLDIGQADGRDRRTLPMKEHPLLADAAWLRARYWDDLMNLREIASLVGCWPNDVLDKMREYHIPRRPPGRSGKLPPKSYAVLRDREALYEQLHNPPRTIVSAAAELGVDKQTVRHWMDKHGIEAPELSPDSPLADAQWLRARYWDDLMTLVEIGQATGVPWKTVRYWMCRHEIPRRPKGRLIPPDARALLADPDWLDARYLDDGLSVEDIAADLGVGRTTVERALASNGLRVSRPE